MFENFCVLLITANAVILGYQVQHMAMNSISDPPELLANVQLCFTLFFLLELIARMSVGLREWAVGDGRTWNWFDCNGVSQKICRPRECSQGSFEVRSGSVRGPFGIRWGSVQVPFGFRKHILTTAN